MSSLVACLIGNSLAQLNGHICVVEVDDTFVTSKFILQDISKRRRGAFIADKSLGNFTRYVNLSYRRDSARRLGLVTMDGQTELL